MTRFRPDIRFPARWLATGLCVLQGLAAVAQDGAAAPDLPPPPDPNPSRPPVKLDIERIDANRFRIGEVTFDHKTREIRFPGVVNMTEGLLEYALVGTHGKIHESLLATDVPATAIKLAFTLLRYPPSEEFQASLNDRGALSDKEVPEAIKAAARIRVSVEWNDAGKTRTVPVSEWIQHATKGTTMPETLWVYGGSFVEQGNFVAETSGELVAIFTSSASLINFPGKDNNDDTVWLPYPKRVPAVGTKVTLVFAPNPQLEKNPRTAPAKAAEKPEKPVQAAEKPAEAPAKPPGPAARSHASPGQRAGNGSSTAYPKGIW